MPVSMSCVRKLPPVLIVAMVEVIVVHAPEPDLLGRRDIGHEARLGGGLRRHVPGWGGHWRVRGHRDGENWRRTDGPLEPECITVRISGYNGFQYAFQGNIKEGKTDLETRVVGSEG
jgi:hypothetical protein